MNTWNLGCLRKRDGKPDRKIHVRLSRQTPTYANNMLILWRLFRRINAHLCLKKFQHIMSIWPAHFWVSPQNRLYIYLLKFFHNIESGRPMLKTGGVLTNFTTRSLPCTRYVQLQHIIISSCRETRMTRTSRPSLMMMTPTTIMHRRTSNIYGIRRSRRARTFSRRDPISLYPVHKCVPTNCSLPQQHSDAVI